MVHTQAQHIVLTLAAFTVLAGPLGGAAVALGDDEVTVSVDGNLRGRYDRTIAPAPGSPLPPAEVDQGFAVRFRTTDMVIVHPAREANDAAGGPLALSSEGARADAPARSVFIPWYYMMDDRSIRPYETLFWDTGTAWYLALADETWATYSAPLGAHPSPLGSVAVLTPDLRLRTVVEEVDVGASFQVLLNSALSAAQGDAFTRPSAPTALGGADLILSTEQLLAAAPEATPLLAAGKAPLAVSGAAGSTHPAQGAGYAPLLGLVSAQMAAAGAATLLAGLAAYHLIRKNAILKNKVRGRIADLVHRQPGSTITDIAVAVGVTHQTASYHLRLLQEHGLVLGVERGNKRLYFRNDGSFNNEERGLVAVLRDPESMRVLDLIRQSPWIMKNEAAAALGVSRNTLNWHLQKLLSAGLVSEARENGHCFLFCNRRAAGEVMSQVVQKVQDRGVPGALAELQAPPMPSVVFEAQPVPLGNGHYESVGG